MVARAVCSVCLSVSIYVRAPEEIASAAKSNANKWCLAAPFQVEGPGFHVALQELLSLEQVDKKPSGNRKATGNGRSIPACSETTKLLDSMVSVAFSGSEASEKPLGDR